MEFHFTKWNYNIFSSDIWFTGLILIDPFPDAKNIYLNYFRHIFKILFCFVLLKKITGLCSIRNGVSYCEMESLYLSFLHLNLFELFKGSKVGSCSFESIIILLICFLNCRKALFTRR